MEINNAIARIRRFTRTTLSGKTDNEIIDSINDAEYQFAKDVYGFTKETYLTISPKFDTRTNFAIHIHCGTVDADYAITATDRDNTTGTIVANDLSTQLAATTLSVAWSTTTWKFTVTDTGGDDITISAPEGIIYVDASALLGLSGTGTSGTFAGSIPVDCTIEIDMPSDFLSIVPPVEWDKYYKLQPAPFDIFAGQQTQGIPIYYGIRSKKMRLYPCPSSQKEFHIWYRYLPVQHAAAYQECGLSGKSLTSSTGLTASTPYTFKLAIDGGTSTQYTITTASDVTYEAVIDLMNDQSKGATFSLVNGDLRCTSDSFHSNSAITLAAVTSGTSLWTTIGVSAFDTAVTYTGSGEVTPCV